MSEAADIPDYPEILALAMGYPGAESRRAWGQYGVKVGKKAMFWNGKEAGVLVLPCPLEEREALLAAYPEALTLTDHYRKYPYVLGRIGIIDRALLVRLFDAAWRAGAPKRLVNARR